MREEEHQALLSCAILDDWHMDMIKAAKLTEDGLVFECFDRAAVAPPILHHPEVGDRANHDLASG